MKGKSVTVKVERRQKRGGALRLAIGLGLLLGAATPVWAQEEEPPSDEFGAHVQRAEQLLKHEKPSEALRELAAAFALRQEPRVLYLQGRAQQQLGNDQEARLLLQRFLVAADVASCCSEERRDAYRRIVGPRLLVEPGDPAGGPAEPVHQPEERNAGSEEEMPAADENSTHVQRAKQLLRSNAPSLALQELDEAWAMRREPHVLYLQGVAHQELGMTREAILHFQSFLVAAPSGCCADERAYASRRIAKLRPLLGPFNMTPIYAQQTNAGPLAAIIISSVVGGLGLLALAGYGVSQIRFNWGVNVGCC